MVSDGEHNREKTVNPGASDASQRALDAKQRWQNQTQRQERADEVGAGKGNEQEREWVGQLEHVEECVHGNQVVGIAIEGFPSKL